MMHMPIDKKRIFSQNLLEKVCWIRSDGEVFQHEYHFNRWHRLVSRFRRSFSRIGSRWDVAVAGKVCENANAESVGKLIEW